jgi:predicted RNA-binding protein with PUA-like domain
MKYWLVKSEPDVYGIDDLKKDGTTWWEGVRNYQARNFMRDDMKPGDPVLFYHSNTDVPGIAGVAVVSAAAAADKTQFDKKSDYFDGKSKPAAPTWVCPEIRFVEKFPEVISLESLRAQKSLAGMALLQKGQRLSVQPVDETHFAIVKAMAAPSVGTSKRGPSRKTTSKLRT